MMYEKGFRVVSFSPKTMESHGERCKYKKDVKLREAHCAYIPNQEVRLKKKK